MLRRLKADRDAYITDMIVRGTRRTASNVGGAGTLDLFKLYGESGDDVIELSRLLVHFDLNPLRALVAAQRIDPGDPSFNCTLRLRDVYGGQPTPDEFSVDVHPLSQSFVEGRGRDVVELLDRDVCNFISASWGSTWVLSGAAAGGLATDQVDYIDNVVLQGVTRSLAATQVFVNGTEDLEVDVTLAVSCVLGGSVPDAGFRVALAREHEDDHRTYFVKRFSARTAYDESKRPSLDVRFDDSLSDDSAAATFDTSSSFVLWNRQHGRLTNIMSGGNELIGTSCMQLRLITEVSGGWYELAAPASQCRRGMFPIAGVYSASFFLSSSDPILAAKVRSSGSVDFTPVWGSIDGTIAFLTGSTITVKPPERSNGAQDARPLIASVSGLRPTMGLDEIVMLRITLFDSIITAARTVKRPIIEPSVIVHDLHVQVRDAHSGEIVLPIDTTHNSSRASSDGVGHYYELATALLPPGRAYVIDVVLCRDEALQTLANASGPFRVSATP